MKASTSSGWSELFLRYRPYLISFAFRMTGSLAEAEDIVQDVFLQTATTDLRDIENPKSWLTKVCSNKALDLLKSAARKREDYPGTWLPDAVPESYQLWTSHQDGGSPERDFLVRESMTTSFLLLAEKLSPEQRAVYLLSEIFGYSFGDISAFLNKSEATCRKTAQRARESISSEVRRFTTTNDVAAKVIGRFFEAAKQGDREALTSLLADGSEFWSDGGGKVSAARGILSQIPDIARFFIGLGKSPLFVTENFRFEFQIVNARPGWVITQKLSDGTWAFETILSFEFENEKIVRIYAQRNPDKLKALNLIHREP